jgi:hypothetical protein
LGASDRVEDVGWEVQIRFVEEPSHEQDRVFGCQFAPETPGFLVQQCVDVSAGEAVSRC